MKSISDYLYARAAAEKIPLGATFELSPVCNFSCRMCYVRKTMPQIQAEGKHLRHWTEWLEIARQCREAGSLYLLLTGGEPFIYPHFRELYMKLHEMGFVLYINTNGTMIDRETVQWLKKAAPGRVNITLYGSSPKTYERICGRPDGYEKAVAAIRMLKEAGITVVINGSMIPENQDDLEEIMAFGRDLGVHVRAVTYMFPPVRREGEATDSRFTPAQAAAMAMRRQRFLTGDNWNEYVSSQLDMVPNEAEASDADWGEKEEFMRCRAGRSSFWISWDGRMTACGMMDFPKVTYPFEKPFMECWSEITDAVRSMSVLQGCSNCPKRKICKPCVAMIQSETGTTNKKAPYLCEMTDCMIADMKDDIQSRKE